MPPLRGQARPGDRGERGMPLAPSHDGGGSEGRPPASTRATTSGAWTLTAHGSQLACDSPAPAAAASAVAEQDAKFTGWFELATACGHMPRLWPEILAASFCFQSCPYPRHQRPYTWSCFSPHSRPRAGRAHLG
ncbi:hypothetical protein SKAU_G00311380 [Synaphobranchus kaupii]|uniref:Uncharacterized protein n=1 Tax=Synaphobranchus kaupii TaxID=118154 RepID=A0A9Q1IJ63_SYNKA|nr:hypothetical protein SKAU_G00311380 [Synaphobranchus kaupii]